MAAEVLGELCDPDHAAGHVDDSRAVRLAGQVAGGDEPQPVAPVQLRRHTARHGEVVAHRPLRTRKDVPQQGEYRPHDPLRPPRPAEPVISRRRRRSPSRCSGSFGSIVRHRSIEVQVQSGDGRHRVAPDEHRHDRRAALGGFPELAAYPVVRPGEPDRDSPGCPIRLRSRREPSGSSGPLRGERARTTRVGAGRGCRGRPRPPRRRPRGSTRSVRPRTARRPAGNRRRSTVLVRSRHIQRTAGSDFLDDFLDASPVSHDQKFGATPRTVSG